MSGRRPSMDAAGFAAERIAGSRSIAWIAWVAGAGAWAWLLATDPLRAWLGLLLAVLVPMGLAAGALAWHALHLVVGAQWHRPLLPELRALPALLPLAAAGAALVLAGLLFVHPPWLHAAPADDRAWWWSPWRGAASTAAILGLWWWLARRLLAVDAERRRALGWAVAVLAALLYGGTVLAWDLLTLLAPGWSSAIWGVQALVAAVQAVLAVLLLHGRRHDAVACRSDLGTWLMAWSCLAAYLAYSQYGIIWYANLPHEAGPLAARLDGGWQWQYLLAIALRWAVPFALLIPPAARRSPRLLGGCAVSVLAGLGVEWAWFIGATGQAAWRVPWAELAILVAVLALCLRMARVRGGPSVSGRG